MMLQICNRCEMMCPHCLDDATPDGGLMDRRTFDKALEFAIAVKAGHLVVSGGEPTAHPDFLSFCRSVSDSGLTFSVCTNGMWLGDEKGEWRMERVAKLKRFLGAQVYTNPRWYRLHETTVERYRRQESRWQSLGVKLDTTEVLNMQDLGRARTCKEAIAEMERHRYHNSCLTAHTLAAQTPGFPDFFKIMVSIGHFCTPLIDWAGGFHMSESWLCQSFGNVITNTPDEIWGRISRSRPCGGCRLYNRFLSNDTPKMVRARELLGIGQTGQNETKKKKG